MKNLIVLFVLTLLSFGTVEAQRATVYTLAVDTLQGAESVNFEAVKITGDYNSLVVQALCTQTGGTSDGSLIIKGSVDGVTYTTLNSTDNFLYAYPNDTLTITNGASVVWQFESTPYLYYRVTGTGTSGDSTKVAIKYVYK